MYSWEINIKLNSPGNKILNVTSKSHEVNICNHSDNIHIKFHDGVLLKPNKDFIM